MYERILIPLDGSDGAESALPMARSLASRLHAELILLRVNEPIPNLPAGRYPETIGLTAREYLRRTAEPMILRNLKIRTHVEYGEPAAVIARCAREQRADLVVMAAGARFRRRIPTGTTARVLRLSEIPILVIPA